MHKLREVINEGGPKIIEIKPVLVKIEKIFVIGFDIMKKLALALLAHSESQTYSKRLFML